MHPWPTRRTPILYRQQKSFSALFLVNGYSRTQVLPESVQSHLREYHERERHPTPGNFCEAQLWTQAHMIMFKLITFENALID